MPNDTTSPRLACPSCIFYVLFCQITFLKRWNSIQVAAPSVSPLQAHRSIHRSTPVANTVSSPQRRRTTKISTPLPGHLSQPLINLILTIHTINAIDTFLPTGKATHTNAHVHLAHTTMTIDLYHLRQLHTCISPSTTQNIPHRIICHHLLNISARSPLVPKDRSLSLTIDNHIHLLTFNHPNAPTIRLHHRHLFLNPYKRTPYFL